MRYVFLVLNTVSIFLLFSIPGMAQDFRYAPPREKWYTVESEHFSITFPEQEREVAYKLLKIAEYYYPIMTGRMRWTPRGKTYILISNASDLANAETTTYYYNHIIIFAVPPDAYSSIINYDDWLKMIFVHEYTHVLHLDQTRGFFGFLNNIFGRILFVNQIEPDWFIEGYAVYNESTLTSDGRNNGTYYNTILRLQALDNKLPPIDEGDGMPSKWPFGEYPYVYGGKFIQYLANKYSDNALARYAEEYTYLPLLLNRDAKLAFGKKDFVSLWAEWEEMVKIQAFLNTLSVMISGNTPLKQITHVGAYTRGPVWDTAGNGIFYTSYSGKSQMGIFYTDLTTGKNKWIVRRNNGYSDSTCDHFLFFSQNEFFENFYLYNDLYAFNIKTNQLKRLTYGLRVHGADASSDCTKIVFVSNTSMRSELMIYHVAEPGFITTIASIEENGQFLNPRWSWDGKYIAVTIKNNNGESGIKIFDTEGKEFTTVISNTHLNIFPSWSRDDRYVIFSSDMTGIANLYAYSITEQSLYQVTNLIGGAYESQISPDNKMIALTNYDSSGFNIYIMPFSPATFKKVSPLREFTVEELEKYKHVNAIEKAYSPISTIMPTWWLPAISLARDVYSFGIYTAGSDLLDHNNYTLRVGYAVYPDSGSWPGFAASYDNTSCTPDIGIAGSVTPHIAASYKDPIKGTQHAYIQQIDSISIGLTYPVNHVRYRQLLSAGYHYSYKSSITQLPAYVINPPFTGALSGFNASYSMDTTSVFNTSISNEDGIYFNTYFERDLPFLGSDRNISQSYSIIKGYIPGFGVNHVIYIKGIYGFVAGGSNNSLMLSIGGSQPFYNNMDYTTVPVRGYPAASLIGTEGYGGSFEYRYPLGIIDRGISTLPFYFDKLSIFPFFDIGSNGNRTITSTGIELNIDTYIGYLFPFRFTIGYAYAYNMYPASSFYFLLGEIF